MDNQDSADIQKVLSGDPGAYEPLVRRHQSKIFRLCRSLLRNEADGEDAAQEVFIKAYQSLSQFQQNSSFYTWLYRIASNHCLSLLRSKARRSTQSLDSLLENEGDKIERLFASSADARRSLESAELVEKILASLNAKQRLIVTLREVEGLSYEEITQVLECSLDSVKAQLRRAREEIEKQLRHFLPERASK